MSHHRLAGNNCCVSYPGDVYLFIFRELSDAHMNV